MTAVFVIAGVFFLGMGVFALVRPAAMRPSRPRRHSYHRGRGTGRHGEGGGCGSTVVGGAWPLVPVDWTLQTAFAGRACLFTEADLSA